LGTTIRTHIVKIGNSQGIRLPKTLIEQGGLAAEREVEVSVQDNALVIRAARHPREGWDAMFQAMAAAGDDTLLDGDAPSTTAWDATEWEGQSRHDRPGSASDGR
jgi:antitoxin MazE